MIARGAAYASAIPFRMSVPVASDGAHRTYTGADATTVAAPRVAPILTIKALEGWHRFHTYSHKTICDRWQRNIMTSSGNIGSNGSRVAGYIFGIGCLDLSAYIVEHKVVVHHLDTIGICNLQAAMACLTAGNVHPEARCHPTSIYHKEIVGANIRSLKNRSTGAGIRPVCVGVTTPMASSSHTADGVSSASLMPMMRLSA